MQVMCVLFTEDVGGVLTLEFSPEGVLEFKVQVDEQDYLFDEIGSELKIREYQREKRELLEALEMFYRVFFMGIDVGEVERMNLDKIFFNASLFASVPYCRESSSLSSGSLPAKPALSGSNTGVCAAPFQPSSGMLSPSGMVTQTENEKLEPLPFSLSTEILPPISSTSCLQMFSPSPVPP